MIVAGGVPLFAADMYAYPIPWVPEGSKTRLGNATDGIHFANAPAQGEIYIYTVTGALVAHFDYSGVVPQWLGKNDKGEDSGSGVYLWVLKSGGSTETGKLIVIR